MADSETLEQSVTRILSSYQNKQRNLKKRKAKLDDYKAKLNAGETLNDEQKKAVDDFAEVLKSIAVMEETINVFKELQLKVRDSVKQNEDAVKKKHEEHTLNFLNIHITLIRFLESLNNANVRTAVSKASSDESLRSLDALRKVLLPQLPINWPGSSSAAISNTPAFLQSHQGLKEKSQNVYNFVMGRSVPVPFSSVGESKKSTYKDVRNLCFKLLANPRIQSVLENKNENVAKEHKVEHTFKDLNEINPAFACQHTPQGSLVGVGSFQVDENMPTFNFIQASKVMPDHSQSNQMNFMEKLIDVSHQNEGKGNEEQSAHQIKSEIFEQDRCQRVDEFIVHNNMLSNENKDAEFMEEPTDMKNFSYADLVRKAGKPNNILPKQSNELRKNGFNERPPRDTHRENFRSGFRGRMKTDFRGRNNPRRGFGRGNFNGDGRNMYHRDVAQVAH